MKAYIIGRISNRQKIRHIGYRILDLETGRISDADKTHVNKLIRKDKNLIKNAETRDNGFVYYVDNIVQLNGSVSKARRISSSGHLDRMFLLDGETAYFINDCGIITYKGPLASPYTIALVRELIEQRHLENLSDYERALSEYKKRKITGKQAGKSLPKQAREEAEQTSKSVKYSDNGLNITVEDSDIDILDLSQFNKKIAFKGPIKAKRLLLSTETDVRFINGSEAEEMIIDVLNLGSETKWLMNGFSKIGRLTLRVLGLRGRIDIAVPNKLNIEELIITSVAGTSHMDLVYESTKDSYVDVGKFSIENVTLNFLPRKKNKNIDCGDFIFHGRFHSDVKFRAEATFDLLSGIECDGVFEITLCKPFSTSVRETTGFDITDCKMKEIIIKRERDLLHTQTVLLKNVETEKAYSDGDLYIDGETTSKNNSEVYSSKTSVELSLKSNSENDYVKFIDGKKVAISFD